MAFHCECGDHAWAPLTKGLVTFVSPEDASLLRYSWCAQKSGRSFRAQRSVRSAGRRQCLLLAREIVAAEASVLVDHANLNPLDNRRGNLRLCTKAQNNFNRQKYRHSKQAFKGIHEYALGRFRARIRIAGKVYSFGPFASAEAAHAAYCAASITLHGEFGRAS